MVRTNLGQHHRRGTPEHVDGGHQFECDIGCGCDVSGHRSHYVGTI